MSVAPRRLLLNDEGSSALHFLDMDRPERGWTFRGAGRDLQLIGGDRVLRSVPNGFVELELHEGKLAREVTPVGISGIESARRSQTETTLLLGNSARGIFIVEIDEAGRRLRTLEGVGLEKGRLLRHAADESLLFCSETGGRRVIHRATFDGGITTLFEVPTGVAADSMLKAVERADGRIVVSTGYAASLLVIDAGRGEVVQTIGGKQQTEPSGLRRALSPHFFSGYQIKSNGDYLIANWQGHGPSHAADGYQLLMYSADGQLTWCFDQTEHPQMTSLNNVIALDELDTSRLHDERQGVLAPLI